MPPWAHGRERGYWLVRTAIPESFSSITSFLRFFFLFSNVECLV